MALPFYARLFADYVAGTIDNRLIRLADVGWKDVAERDAWLAELDVPGVTVATTDPEATKGLNGDVWVKVDDTRVVSVSFRAIDAWNTRIIPEATEAIEQRVVHGSAATTASEDTKGKIVLYNEEAELTEEYTAHEATPQQVQFVDYASANLIGFLGADPPVDAYNVEQWYWNTISKRARVLTDLDPITPGVQKGFIDAVLTELIPGDEAYAGEYQSDELAAPHIDNVGDIYYNIADESLRVANSITPGAGRIKGLKFKRIATEADLHEIYTRFQILLEAITKNADKAGLNTRSLVDLDSRLVNGLDLQSVTVATPEPPNLSLIHI